MRTVDFDFELPPGLIAQFPAAKRDESRLLVLHRCSGTIEHRPFRDFLGFLRSGDLLVLNNSRVIPARLRGANAQSRGEFEILLLEENAVNDWWAMMRPGKRAPVGTTVLIQGAQGVPTDIQATVLDTNAEGHRRLRFSGASNISEQLENLGEVPLPPYIRRETPARVAAPTGECNDRERYQTVYARPLGSVAAPTAGLHFTEALLNEIRSRGIQICSVTLHVGLGTFAPVKSETIEGHTMHEERYELSEAAAQMINAAKREGRRVIAVGTTTVRVLESAAREGDKWPAARGMSSENMSPVTRHLPPRSGRTSIFIYPPYGFRLVDALLTNFHLPCSTLLMLVSAFAAPEETRGREMVLSAYAEAVRERYRFFSYGDAMLLL